MFLEQREEIQYKIFKTIQEELKSYSEKLAGRKQILVANKLDVMQNEDLLKQLETFAKEEQLELFKISAVTGEGIDTLMNRVTENLKELPKEELVEIEEKMVYTLEDKNEYTVTKHQGLLYSQFRF